MATNRNSSVAVNASLFGCGGIIVYLLNYLLILNDRITYAALTLIMLSYFWVEVKRIRRVELNCWLVNPALLCVFFTFVMGYGITNVLFFMPSGQIELLGLVPEVTQAMVKHQLLALLGAISLFLGYWSPLSEQICRPTVTVRFLHRFIPRSDYLNSLSIPILLITSILIRLFLISIGLYGYGSDLSAERLSATAAYSQYLALAGSLGTLALLLSALSYFSSNTGRNSAFWFWITLFSEISFGVLSGMKSAILVPFLVICVCLYLRKGIVSTRWIAISLASILIAYAIIEPFRVIRNQQTEALTSVTDLVTTLQDGLVDTNSSESVDENPSTFLAILSRSNLSYIGSYAIDYSDANPQPPDGSPAFLNDIILSPVYALVPRFVWDSKPLGNLGTWYNEVVLARGTLNSVGMGPLAYLYFAGGFFGVTLGFFVIGVLQRCLWLLSLPWSGQPNAVLFIVLLPTLVFVDSSVYGTVINLIRYSVLLLFLIPLLYRRSSQPPIISTSSYSNPSVHDTRK
jgi:hypothetical protein